MVPEVEAIEGEVTVNQGAELSLTCHASGTPIPVILWQLEGLLLVPTADSRITLPTPASLQVRYVTADDAGQYTCIAENAAGTDFLTTEVIVRRKYTIYLTCKTTGLQS